MILVVSSTEDIASMNIAKKVIDHYRFTKASQVFLGNPVYSKKLGEQEVRLVSVNEDITDTQAITNFFTPKLLVFISRHSSTSGKPTLSVHVPGNLTNEATLGGIPGKVSVAAPCAMREALTEMKRLNDTMQLDYEVSYECTHHGPSLDVATMFTELGSSPEQWKDSKAAEVVAHATMAAVSRRSECRAVLGIGGPHYNKKFTKIALTTKTAFGHIIPKYAIAQVDVGMIRQCVRRTAEPVESAILEWKGIRGADRGKLIAALDRMGVPVERI